MNEAAGHLWVDQRRDPLGENVKSQHPINQLPLVTKVVRIVPLHHCLGLHVMMTYPIYSELD